MEHTVLYTESSSEKYAGLHLNKISNKNIQMVILERFSVKT